MSPFSLGQLFEDFIQEKLYLNNLSPKTIRSYRQAFNAYQRVLSKQYLHTSRADEAPTKDTLKDFVIGLRKSMSPGGANVYIRSMSSFLSWLHTEGHISEPLNIPHLLHKSLAK